MGRERQNHLKFPVLLLQKGSVGADSAFFVFAVFSLKWERLPMGLDWLDLQVEHSLVSGVVFLFLFFLMQDPEQAG